MDGRLGHIIGDNEETHANAPKRGFKRYSWAPYDMSKAMLHVLAPHVRSCRQYRVWHKEMRVKCLPKYPEHVFPNFSWKRFLEVDTDSVTDIIKKRRNIRSKYRPVWESVKFTQGYCRKNHITTIDQWQKQYDHSTDIPEDIPKYPHAIYDDFPGYKAWLGKELTAILDTEANMDSVITLVHMSNMPDNVVNIKVWSGGMSDLRENWSKQSDFDKIYGKWKYERELMPKINEILVNFGSNDSGYWIISNLNEVLWELNTLLMMVR